VRSGLVDAGIVAFGSSRSGRGIKKRAREGSKGHFLCTFVDSALYQASCCVVPSLKNSNQPLSPMYRIQHNIERSP